MDYYKCEKCGKVFDKFEMNYIAAYIDKHCWCRDCREKVKMKVEIMEAKDSAMTDEQIAKVLQEDVRRTQGREVALEYFGASRNDRVIAEAQAKISFKMGYNQALKDLKEKENNVS